MCVCGLLYDSTVKHILTPPLLIVGINILYQSIAMVTNTAALTQIMQHHLDFPVIDYPPVVPATRWVSNVTQHYHWVSCVGQNLSRLLSLKLSI